jgi:hypothetical protein
MKITLLGYVLSISLHKQIQPSYMVDILSQDDEISFSGWLDDYEAAQQYARVKLQWLYAKNIKAKAIIFSSEDSCEKAVDVLVQTTETICSIRSVEVLIRK